MKARSDMAEYRYLIANIGQGMFFYTDCCKNRMFSVKKDPMLYHGKLCPKCFMQNKRVVLYLQGYGGIK